MSLSGAHITFGYCNVGFANGASHAALPFNATSSQTMASAGTTTIQAPSDPGFPVNPQLLLLLSISASAPIFYVTGPNPDINNGARRYYDPTYNAREDILVQAGDKVAWTFA